jgi:hypothetical protein
MHGKDCDNGPVGDCCNQSYLDRIAVMLTIDALCVFFHGQHSYDLIS